MSTSTNFHELNLDFKRGADGSYGLPGRSRSANKSHPKLFCQAAISLLAAVALGAASLRIDMRPLASEFKQINSARSFTKPSCSLIRNSFSIDGLTRAAGSFLPADIAPKRASDRQLQECHIAPPRVR